MSQQRLSKERGADDMDITNERYKDLLIGALYELKQIVNNFEDLCDTIGITADERAILDI